MSTGRRRLRCKTGSGAYGTYFGDGAYINMTMIGRGAYGVVYKATKVDTGSAVAIKRTRLDDPQETDGIPMSALREIAVLKVVEHPNIVRLLDVTTSPRDISLVFEFSEMDLKRYMLDVGGAMDPKIIKSLSEQLMKGIECCHRNAIIHRDVKPQNLLIDYKLQLKIADFGLARMFKVPVPSYTTEVMTLWYRPPELLLGSTLYSVPADIWSVGCVIAEMATPGCNPVFGGCTSEISTIFEIFKKLGTPTFEEWPGLAGMPSFKMRFPTWTRQGWADLRNTMGDAGIDLLDRCMQYDPGRRISARRAIVHHPYCCWADPYCRIKDGVSSSGNGSVGAAPAGGGSSSSTTRPGKGTGRTKGSKEKSSPK